MTYLQPTDHRAFVNSSLHPPFVRSSICPCLSIIHPCVHIFHNHARSLSQALYVDINMNYLYGTCVPLKKHRHIIQRQ